MDHFLADLKSGDLHFRDRWQFELKTEIFPHISLDEHVHKQEYYLFIPNTLQVNRWTYTKEQFYLDQSNFIRYKTPEMSITEVCDLQDPRSPLGRIDKNFVENLTAAQLKEIEDELKLMGNIVRSALRRDIALAVEKIHKNPDQLKVLWKKISDEYHLLRMAIGNLEKHIHHSQKTSDPLNYVDEYISNMYNYYLVGLLECIRVNPLEVLQEVDYGIVEVLNKEESYRFQHFEELKRLSSMTESVLYRLGLLNKFVLDALTLRINRFSTEQKWGQWIAASSAFLAMLVFSLFFVWQGTYFVVNGLSFILVTSMLYILKDRMKDWLRNLSHQQATRWFSDYTTEIKASNREHTIGELKENFSFVHESSLPKEIVEMRNREFHQALESFKRPENIIYYKKTVEIRQKPSWIHSRRYGLNVIFRFNIQNFMRKAGNPFVPFTYLEQGTNHLITRDLPKVYHLNIIMKSTFVGEDLKTHIDYRKYRLVVNKNGIIRIEHVGMDEGANLSHSQFNEGFRESVDDVGRDQAEGG